MFEFGRQLALVGVHARARKAGEGRVALTAADIVDPRATCIDDPGPMYGSGSGDDLEHWQQVVSGLRPSSVESYPRQLGAERAGCDRDERAAVPTISTAERELRSLCKRGGSHWHACSAPDARPDPSLAGLDYPPIHRQFQTSSRAKTALSWDTNDAASGAVCHRNFCHGVDSDRSCKDARRT